MDTDPQQHCVNGDYVSVLYHEKQSRQLCALHALNNLLQGKIFTQKDLDSICYELSPESRYLNPHKSPIGLGNYDVNVIMKALQIKGLDAVWFDRRKNPSTINLNVIKGFIINVPNPCSWFTNYFISSSIMSRKHWITIIRHADRDTSQDLYYNLDSKLSKPLLIGTKHELINYLRTKNNECEILLVVDSELRNCQGTPWIVNDPDQQQS